MRAARASPVPASLDHNDLHQQNVLGGGPYRFYDWGDAVVAHAFAALLVPSQVLSGEPLERARAAYLEAFADLAPPAQLAEELGSPAASPDRPRAHLGARAALGPRAGRAGRPVLRRRPLRGAHGAPRLKRLVDPVDAEAHELGRREQVAGGRADRAGDADPGLERGGPAIA